MRADLLVPCDGPVGWRRVPDPPPLEIDTDTGLLIPDDGDPANLRYVIVPA